VLRSISLQKPDVEKGGWPYIRDIDGVRVAIVVVIPGRSIMQTFADKGDREGRSFVWGESGFGDWASISRRSS
jgi:hypothetical protein